MDGLYSLHHFFYCRTFPFLYVGWNRSCRHSQKHECFMVIPCTGTIPGFFLLQKWTSQKDDPYRFYISIPGFVYHVYLASGCWNIVYDYILCFCCSYRKFIHTDSTSESDIVFSLSYESAYLVQPIPDIPFIAVNLRNIVISNVLSLL